MDTYRGYEIVAKEDGRYWVDAAGNVRGPFKTLEDAMDAIDAYRRELRASHSS